MQGQALLDAQHPSTRIIPLTSQLIDDAKPLRIHVTPQGRLSADSDLLIEQLHAIDYRRLIDGPLLRCDGEMMMRVYAAIQDIMQT